MCKIEPGVHYYSGSLYTFLFLGALVSGSVIQVSSSSHQPLNEWQYSSQTTRSIHRITVLSSDTRTITHYVVGPSTHHQWNLDEHGCAPYFVYAHVYIHLWSYLIAYYMCKVCTNSQLLPNAKYATYFTMHHLTIGYPPIPIHLSVGRIATN